MGSANPRLGGKSNAPYILAQSAVPVALAPNGTVATNGQIALGVGLPTTYSNGVWLNLPAGAVSGGPAGLYWAVMTSPTAGQVYTNYVNTSGEFIPFIPSGTLTPAVGSNVAYTQSVIQVLLVNVSVPGGAMGPNGAIRVTTVFHASGGGGTKAFRGQFGGSTCWNLSSITANAAGGQLSIRNRGVLNAQYNINAATGDASSSAGAVVYGTVNTALAAFFGLTAQLVSAADGAVIESFIVEVLPG
jgi:hypothetical protein